MLEGEYFFIFFREVLKVVPLAGFEVFEPLVILVLFPQHVLNCVLNFVLELELIFFPHLYLDSLGFLLIFISQNLLLVERFLHFIFVGNVLEPIVFFHFLLGLSVLGLKLQAFQS